MSIIDQGVVAVSERVIAWIACGLAVVGLMLPIVASGPNTETIAIAALVLPPIIMAMVLMAPEGFWVRVRGSDRRTLNIFPALSVFGLAMPLSHVGMMNWSMALILAGLCAAVALLLGVGLVGRRLPGGLLLSVLFWGAFGGGYGYGAAVFADTRFDHNLPQIYPAQVQRQYMSHRGGSTRHLVLGPWGPMTGTTDIAVSLSAYDALIPGQTACVTLHPGALRMPWYRAGVCSPGREGPMP